MLVVHQSAAASPLAAGKMVLADGTPLVETCVLLPAEFALKVETQQHQASVASLLHLLPHLAPRVPPHLAPRVPPYHLSGGALMDHLAPSFGPLSSPLTSLAPALNPLGAPPLGRLPVPTPEDCIQVCATRRLPAHTRYLPFSGTVRTDNLPLLPCLPPIDPRQRYGSYDEVCERSTGRVRLCNWVRFLCYSLHFTPHVNMVASRVRELKRTERHMTTLPAFTSDSDTPAAAFTSDSDTPAAASTSDSDTPAAAFTSDSDTPAAASTSDSGTSLTPATASTPPTASSPPTYSSTSSSTPSPASPSPPSSHYSRTSSPLPPSPPTLPSSYSLSFSMIVNTSTSPERLEASESPRRRNGVSSTPDTAGNPSNPPKSLTITTPLPNSRSIITASIVSSEKEPQSSIKSLTQTPEGISTSSSPPSGSSSCPFSSSSSSSAISHAHSYQKFSLDNILKVASSSILTARNHNCSKLEERRREEEVEEVQISPNNSEVEIISDNQRSGEREECDVKR